MPDAAAVAGGHRFAMGLAYAGQQYQGWQSQLGGCTVQDLLEKALTAFVGAGSPPLRTHCAGRTDAGVHAFNQVVHFEPSVLRDRHAWVRGTNRYLPSDIAVQWCQPVSATFHARNSALGRRYTYWLLESPVRPALEAGRCGWSFYPLDGDAMKVAASALIGTHDFSSFRSSQCQSPTPIKTMRQVRITRHGAYWRFDFDGNAFLHHMVRNLMGCLIAVGRGDHPPQWMTEVLAARSRRAAAPTFSADGLYFNGPYYDAAHDIPDNTPAMDWNP